jgi:hypothetical protein
VLTLCGPLDNALGKDASRIENLTTYRPGRLYDRPGVVESDDQTLDDLGVENYRLSVNELTHGAFFRFRREHSLSQSPTPASYKSVIWAAPGSVDTRLS